MIGRHGMVLKPRTLKRIFGVHGHQLTDEDTRKICSTKYAEPLLEYLGATSVDSVDASDYQDANLIADLSKPIPSEWLGRFDTVIDAGTIEHIYNFPQAVENCLGMLKTGGFYMCLTCGNSYSGHGFYQFSPELWFSLFSANHFADIEVFLVPTRPEPPWFRVADPHAIKGRVEVINGEQTYVLAFARKTDRTPLFPRSAAAIRLRTDPLARRGRDSSRQTFLVGPTGTRFAIPAGQHRKVFRAPHHSGIRAFRSPSSQGIRPGSG